MNSSVILATNTQALSGLRTRVNVTDIFFKTGKMSPDAICRTHFVGFTPAVLLRCPAWRSSLIPLYQ
jgi:hypothetical protein